MAIGKVLWFNDLKGYGFVEDESGEQFLLRENVAKKTGRKKLVSGTSVKFSVDKITLEVSEKEVRLVKSLQVL